MYTADFIITAADRLVRKYRTRDPYELCRAMHIVLYRKDLQKKLKGFFFSHSRQKSIVIDENAGPVLEKILIAHELGHAVRHREIALLHGFQEIEMLEGSAKPMEYEANLFAAELLLTDEEVLERLSEMTFFEASRSLCVPAALLDFKFTLLRAKGHRFRSTPDAARADFLKEDCSGYDAPPQ